MGIQIAQLGAILFRLHPVLYSGVFQLLAPITAAVICIRQRSLIKDSAARLRWLAVGTSFGLSSLAQGLFLLQTYHLIGTWVAFRLDDAVWAMCGLPLLLVNYVSGEEKTDRIQLLDRAQATLFFTALYLLIFLPSIKLKFAVAFNIQDMALVLCGLLRLPACKSGLERRFYGHLNVFLIAYGVCLYAGYALYARGWQDGSLADLAWTLPITLFVVLVQRSELWPSTKQDAGRLFLAARNIQGIGITVLAISSLGVSAVLANHNLRLGEAVGVLAFALFAFRMNARERAWDRAHCSLEESVLQDALTGLGNRVLLRRELTERLAQTTENGIVLLFIDLDRFKGINDSLGHLMGDRLLIEVGDRLREFAPADAVVCRIGGDEFVVMTSALDPVEAQSFGEALLTGLHRPIRLGAHTLRCTASVGVVFSQFGTSAEDLLRAADHAMYHAKQTGKDRVQLFDESIMLSLNNKCQMETDLRDAVEAGAITICYQPIARLMDGTIVGIEALARWSHPRWGQVPPSDFIALAEEVGLIQTLGSQIMEKSCRQVAQWNKAWGTSLSVNVNVSPYQFANTGLLQEILRSLEQASLEPSLLRIEVTESALLVNESAVKQTLAQIRSYGIRVALDDFGTGYSSLSYLISLPVDKVKVDRSFVSGMHHDPQCRALVRSVVQLAHSLNKRVVAEGVETEQDLIELLMLGCEFVQGWIVGRPLEPRVFETTYPTISSAFAGLISSLRGSASGNGLEETVLNFPASRKSAVLLN
ncbi:MAG: putative bifunctional diguanylate cyclase/phosphodiesterase [Janthinobacterium lividum]